MKLEIRKIAEEKFSECVPVQRGGSDTIYYLVCVCSALGSKKWTQPKGTENEQMRRLLAPYITVSCNDRSFNTSANFLPCQRYRDSFGNCPLIRSETFII